MADVETVSYVYMGGNFNTTDSLIIVVSHMTQFDLLVHKEDLEGTTYWDEHYPMVQAIDDDIGSAYAAGYITKVPELAVKQCYSLIKQLGRRPAFAPDLSSYVELPGYTIRLHRNGSLVDAKLESGPSPENPYSMHIADLTQLDLPPGLPFFSTSSLHFAFLDDMHYIPRPVLDSSGDRHYFKNDMRRLDGEFAREVNCLCRTRDLDVGDGAGIVRLSGLVYHGDESKVVGLLTGWIEGKSLNELASCASEAETKAWEEQLTATVEKMHAIGVVWGDVHPWNVVVDDQSRPWILDFGGSNHPDFIDEDKAETAEGDWQGLRRVFEFLEKERRERVESNEMRSCERIDQGGT